MKNPTPAWEKFASFCC